MPLPKDMKSCMSYVKDKYPSGRTKENGKSKKAAHKQHVAMCMQASESEETKMQLSTFKEFLVEMTEEEENERIWGASDPMAGFDSSSMRQFIRSLPQYQELLKDKSNKPAALRLAREMVQEFGDGPVDERVQDYVIDMFDDLSREHYKGTALGDWAGEEAYRKQREEEADIESAAKKWEQTTGMDAVTGEDLPKKRRATGARHTERLYTKAAQQMGRMGEPGAEPPAPRERAPRPERTGTKAAAARVIFNEKFGKEKPSVIIRQMMEELGMSKPHATTYYYNMKKKAEQG